MTSVRRSYLPAAGKDWLLPLYDPLVKLIGGDRIRKVLLDQADLRPHDRVLDVGCGTGTLGLLIKRLYPGVEAVGLDPDPKALTRARRKARKAAVAIQFDQGFSDDLPYHDSSFDRVFSSFMFHHLAPEEKEKTLREVRRVLKPGGTLHLVDFTESESDVRGSLVRVPHSSERMKDNSEERILILLRQAGFLRASRLTGGAMLFGQLQVSYFQASVNTGQAEGDQ